MEVSFCRRGFALLYRHSPRMTMPWLLGRSKSEVAIRHSATTNPGLVSTPSRQPWHSVDALRVCERLNDKNSGKKQVSMPIDSPMLWRGPMKLAFPKVLAYVASDPWSTASSSIPDSLQVCAGDRSSHKSNRRYMQVLWRCTDTLMVCQGLGSLHRNVGSSLISGVVEAVGSRAHNKAHHVCEQGTLYCRRHGSFGVYRKGKKLKERRTDFGKTTSVSGNREGQEPNVEIQAMRARREDKGTISPMDASEDMSR